MRYCMYYVLYLHETCMDQGWNKYPEMHPIIAGELLWLAYSMVCTVHLMWTSIYSMTSIILLIHVGPGS